MLHVVARALPGTLLFRTWAEARDLWDRLSVVPSISALVLMPNHVHLLAPEVREPDFCRLMSGYARWRNHRRGVEGPVWQAHPPFHEVPDESHLRRTKRYIHLNPCRAGLVDDPLAWPFSTHRDAVGLSIEPVVRRSADPAAFHAYVSADPTVSVEGTWLPSGEAGPRTRAEEVEAAVSALCRVSPAGLRVRGAGRTLLIQALKAHTALGAGGIGAYLEMDPASVYRTKTGPRDDLRRVERVIGDLRFPALEEGDLRGGEGWGRYRGWR